MVPEKIDINEIKKALHNYLPSRIKCSENEPEKENCREILTDLNEYNFEFSGFIRDNTKFLFCNMLYKDFADFRDQEYLASIASNEDDISDFSIHDENDFAHIEDGGTGVVKFIFDVNRKVITSLKWQGEA